MDTKEIGGRIKNIRKQRKITLKELANSAGCSDVFISQVERGVASPSISTLKNIANGLGVSLVELVKPDGEEFVKTKIVTKSNQRTRFKLLSDTVKCEILTSNLKNKNMEPLFKTIQPGGGSNGLYSHEGEEFGIVLKGSMQLTVEENNFILETGDSFYFESTKKHGYKNISNEICELVWVISPPTF